MRSGAPAYSKAFNREQHLVKYFNYNNKVMVKVKSQRAGDVMTVDCLALFNV